VSENRITDSQNEQAKQSYTEAYPEIIPEKLSSCVELIVSNQKQNNHQFPMQRQIRYTFKDEVYLRWLDEMTIDEHKCKCYILSFKDNEYKMAIGIPMGATGLASNFNQCILYEGKNYYQFETLEDIPSVSVLNGEIVFYTTTYSDDFLDGDRDWDCASFNVEKYVNGKIINDFTTICN